MLFSVMPRKFEIWCTFGNGLGYWRKDDYTAIKTNLSQTVEKMMTDYKALQCNQ